MNGSDYVNGLASRDVYVIPQLAAGLLLLSLLNPYSKANDPPEQAGIQPVAVCCLEEQRVQPQRRRKLRRDEQCGLTALVTATSARDRLAWSLPRPRERGREACAAARWAGLNAAWLRPGVWGLQKDAIVEWCLIPMKSNPVRKRSAVASLASLERNVF